MRCPGFRAHYLAPLAKGKRIRITKLYEIKALEVVVPADVKLKMSLMDSDDVLPRANLVGGALNLEIMRPEGGFHPLADYVKAYTDGETFERAYEDEGGYVTLLKYQTRRAGTAFAVFVSRPGSGVTCSQGDMKTLADAELAASVCLALRAAGK